MIQAKELRIGNYVLHDGSALKITNIIGFCVNMEFSEVSGDRQGEIDIDELQPIPLTPELLGECSGFKKFASGNYYHSPTGFELTPQFWLEGSERAVKVESLHRLQNLYFALTGEELEIALQE